MTLFRLQRKQTMNGLVVYLRANKHIPDLRRAAERERFDRVAFRSLPRGGEPGV
jgi:hypothetical protein